MGRTWIAGIWTLLVAMSSSDVDALPREAIVGVAVLADVWSMDTLEEVATEDDAILIGDVVENAVFWELVEVVEIATISQAAIAEPDVTEADIAEPDISESDDSGPAASGRTIAFEPMEDTLSEAVEAAAKVAGAHFDADGLVFWPVSPTPSLAALIGDDAIGDREITRRVWQYVVDQDLQDPEDNAYVYLDDALGAALDSDADGMTTIEFGECIRRQMRDRRE